MGHAGVAFTDAGGLEVASFPEVSGDRRRAAIFGIRNESVLL